METVKNMNTLKAMERRNLIKLADETGLKITGLYSSRSFTCYYIDGAIGFADFNYKNNKYSVKYFSGCFNPYVVKL